jgi:class 3 adenylate cyclase
MQVRVPDTKYVQVRGHFIAYQVFGEGPADILLVRPALNHLEAQWEEPRFARFMARLGEFARVITFDPAGVGMSDPLPDASPPVDDLWVDDQLAVMEAAGCKRAAVVIAGLAPLGLLLPAFHPDRVTAVVAVDNAPRMVASDDYPLGFPPELVELTVAAAAQQWGSPAFPLAANVTAAMREWLARYRRRVCSPGTAMVRYGFLPHLDVRHILPSIHQPTLLIAHSDTAGSGAAPSHFMAERMPNARVTELPGTPVWFWGYPDPDAVCDEIEQFLTGATRVSIVDRVLTTVAFTDVVGSTQQAAELGDRRWLDTVADFQQLAQAEADRFGGHLLKWTGDGHLATFDAPGRAIRWADSLRRSVPRLGVTIRAGIHTGEVEIRGDDIGGLAVNIARRVCDQATSQQILVSTAVPPLVVGSGFTFGDLGAHELRGVPGEWSLFDVG